MTRIQIQTVDMEAAQNEIVDVRQVGQLVVGRREMDEESAALIIQSAQRGKVARRTAV